MFVSVVPDSNSYRESQDTLGHTEKEISNFWEKLPICMKNPSPQVISRKLLFGTDTDEFRRSANEEMVLISGWRRAHERV